MRGRAGDAWAGLDPPWGLAVKCYRLRLRLMQSSERLRLHNHLSCMCPGHSTQETAQTAVALSDRRIGSF